MKKLIVISAAVIIGAAGAFFYFGKNNDPEITAVSEKYSDREMEKAFDIITERFVGNRENILIIPKVEYLGDEDSERWEYRSNAAVEYYYNDGVMAENIDCMGFEVDVRCRRDPVNIMKAALEEDFDLSCIKDDLSTMRMWVGLARNNKDDWRIVWIDDIAHIDDEDYDYTGISLGVAYRESDIYSMQDREAAASVVTGYNSKEEPFITVRYAGDDACAPEKLAELKSRCKADIDECICFNVDLYASEDSDIWQGGIVNTDTEWYLGRKNGGDWQLIDRQKGGTK